MHGRTLRGASDVPKPMQHALTIKQRVPIRARRTLCTSGNSSISVFRQKKSEGQDGNENEGRTEVVVLEAHAAVTHQVGIPVRNGGNELFERAGGAHVGCKGWAERVHCVSTKSDQRRNHSETMFVHVCRGWVLIRSKRTPELAFFLQIPSSRSQPWPPKLTSTSAPTSWSRYLSTL